MLEALLISFRLVEIVNVFVERLALVQNTVIINFLQIVDLIHANCFFNGVKRHSFSGLTAKKRMKKVHIVPVLSLIAILQTLK